MSQRCQYAIRGTRVMGLALACLFSGTPAVAADPVPVAVGVTFVDPVAIRAADAPLDGSMAEIPADLILTDTARQTRTIVVEAADGSLDVTVSYQ